ncbi:hypothetical protein [Kosakonia cowanii]|uniref:hypothetical protein n=1 Tax=Kosakonia cowanii TaxID=208223 RepID=UPI0028A075BB|nr:hypothetical protein [Kosakonia cowanii]
MKDRLNDTAPDHTAAETVPATELEALAAQLPIAEFPVVIHDNRQRAALAAEALWLFAQRTGMAEDGEPVGSVIVDFIADMMHLCHQVGIISPAGNGLPELIKAAEYHFDAEEEDDF